MKKRKVKRNNSTENQKSNKVKRNAPEAKSIKKRGSSLLKDPEKYDQDRSDSMMNEPHWLNDKKAFSFRFRLPKDKHPTLEKLYEKVSSDINIKSRERGLLALEIIVANLITLLISVQ